MNIAVIVHNVNMLSAEVGVVCVCVWAWRRERGAGSITNRTRPLTARLGIDGLSGAVLFLGAVKRTLSRAGRATAGEKQSCQSKPSQHKPDQQYTPIT